MVGVGMDISEVGMVGAGMDGVGAIVQTIGEKLPALVPILRPVQDLVICKKHSVDLLLFPTQLQFQFRKVQIACEQTQFRI